MEQVIIMLPPNYPEEQLDEISDRLTQSKSVICGYHFPLGSPLDPDSILMNQTSTGTEYFVIPDLNLVSEITQIVDTGKISATNPIQKIAIDLMAFSQILDIQFEPAIAFYELAKHKGHEEALKKLSAFRIGDNGNPEQWINLAQKKTVNVQFYNKIKPLNIPQNLTFPLTHWSKNYAATLQLGQLELKNIPPLEKLQTFLDWMFNSFAMRGGALLYAIHYFAPNNPRKGLLKSLRSNNRDKAILGLKNAAWDMTYLSFFSEKVNQPQDQNVEKRYIFATGDKCLADIARCAIGDGIDQSKNYNLNGSLDRLWQGYSKDIQIKLENYYSQINTVDRFERSKEINLPDIISQGEKTIRSFSFK